MKWIDIPPVWLLAHVAVVWLMRPVASLEDASGALRGVGTALVVLGLALMVAAVWEMARKRTTPIPHMEPDALVDTGIFRWTRNPIYLGDALVLGGLALRWGAPLLLVLVPVFMWIIQIRFIAAEEARLERAFGEEFLHYRQTVRRWI